MEGPPNAEKDINPPLTVEAHKVGNMTQTLHAPQRTVNLANQEACLVQIYPTGSGMGARHSLGTATLILGRDSDCNLSISDPSVSRRHAEIRAENGAHFIVDLQSTNGTFVNDRPIAMKRLKDGDYLRVGNRIFRYLTGGNVEAEYHEEIYRLTIVDGLTGIHNKRYFLEFLDRELVRAARHGRPLSLVFFDIDKFKLINDELGHLCGDFALRELVACLREAVRKDELLARYGGEEFAVVLPETSYEEARLVAERFRATVAGHHFVFEGAVFPVTISLGVATTETTEQLTHTELIRQADEKLYQAKHAGRNRVM